MSILFLFHLCRDWCRSLEKMQEFTQVYHEKRRRFFKLYECMREKFLWCLCDNDVSSFFLSPSACDLSCVFQLDSLCLGMMRFILRSWEEKVFHLQQSFLLNNYLLLPLTWSNIISLLHIPPSIPSVCKFAAKVWKKRM